MTSCKRRATQQVPRRAAPARLVAAALLAAFLLVSHPAMGLLEIQVTDGTIVENITRPDASDPGPIFYDTTDGITFTSGATNIETLWYAEIASATNNTSASGATIQGVPETFSDWYYGKQGSAARFASFNATGTYDADAASYKVPLLFSKSSQGTLTIVSYGAADPSADRTVTTYHWAYDATKNRYVVGPSKDLSLETQLAPASDLLGTSYARTLETNPFVITTVGAAPDYLPTLKQGVHLPLLSLPGSVTWYILMDPPAGVHEDTYTYELQVTAQGL